MIERIKTGIDGFDKLVDGGIPKNSPILISGSPGTFKTIFCLQTLYNNAIENKKCLFITFEQDIKDIEKQMNQFGWKLKKAKNNLLIKTLQEDDPDYFNKIKNLIKNQKFDLIAIDSLASLTGTPLSEKVIGNYSMEKIITDIVPVPLDVDNIIRIKIKTILQLIKQSNATTLLVSEINENQQGFSRDGVSEFLCDGIILLKDMGIVGDMAININIKKMRFTKIDRGYHGIKIGRNGLEINPESSGIPLR